MSKLHIIFLAIKVLRRIVPAAIGIYNDVNDSQKPDITKDNAVDLIKKCAVKKGLEIGNTEAELARTAIHYAISKTDRHKNL